MNPLFTETAPTDPRALPLLQALSEALARLTGSSGEASFSPGDMGEPRSVFLLALKDGVPEACGGLRQVDAETCEIKRMYSKTKRSGTGTGLLAELERHAGLFGYTRIVLETRKINAAAVSFYLKNQYVVTPNYGKYAGNELAVCFEKTIGPSQFTRPSLASEEPDAGHEHGDP